MNLAKLSQHLLDGHDLFFMGEEDDSTFDDWICAESMWKTMGSPTYDTTESENEVLENTSQNEEKEPTLVQQLPPTFAKVRNSDSSSDSSSGNISSSRSKKKSHSKRTLDRVDTKINTLVNKAETDQQRNDSRFKTLDENQTEVKNHLYKFEHTLNGKLDDLTVQNIASQNELRTIHEGIVSNTVKIMSDAESQKKRCENLEKYCESLAEQMEKISQPPIQPDPIVQAPVNEHKEIDQLNDSTGLSSVQNLPIMKESLSVSRQIVPNQNHVQ